MWSGTWMWLTGSMSLDKITPLITLHLSFLLYSTGVIISNLHCCYTIRDNNKIEDTNAESRHLCHCLCGLYHLSSHTMVLDWASIMHQAQLCSGPRFTIKGKRNKASKARSQAPSQFFLAHSGLAPLETRLVLRTFQPFGNVTKPLRTILIVSSCV